ncbi:MAG: multiubiquitin domain-containing protein [Gammaproteobacteria bacterium]|nr:multiubiquitin domain-containing protein [Gammaproteobacteria bacterium]MDA7961076.1 multiubiquitin domain-containing protein [Gammaproteobacteria bacterium]MDA8023203.1 multiubiquitin domain-containing protein [Gammaproteobacteria bacterium]
MAQKATITICGNEKDVESGLAHACDLYKLADLSPDKKWLYLDKDKDIDIPLLPDDYIIIHGGEKILSGDVSADIGDNPSVRNPVCVHLNDKRLEEGFKKAKVTGKELRELDKELDASRLFANLRGRVDEFIKDEWVLVVQEKDRYLTIPVSATEDAIDLEKCARANRKPPKGQKHYAIKIDGYKYKVGQALAGAAILKLAGGKTYGDWTLNQKFHGGRRKAVGQDEEIDFSEPGVERFETVRKQAQQGR